MQNDSITFKLCSGGFPRGSTLEIHMSSAVGVFPIPTRPSQAVYLQIPSRSSPHRTHQDLGPELVDISGYLSDLVDQDCRRERGWSRWHLQNIGTRKTHGIWKNKKKVGSLWLGFHYIQFLNDSRRFGRRSVGENVPMKFGIQDLRSEEYRIQGESQKLMLEVSMSRLHIARRAAARKNAATGKATHLRPKSRLYWSDKDEELGSNEDKDEDDWPCPLNIESSLSGTGPASPASPALSVCPTASASAASPADAINGAVPTTGGPVVHAVPGIIVNSGEGQAHGVPSQPVFEEVRVFDGEAQGHASANAG
ncbi:hypothetical protein DFH07DRAFT_778150 [Mycena maculata]|uniref:Uncharacterized protein n=1 Tax=Mycena maculata TaxID=230809 RepID=A0AAD7IGX6_9AGAR|nr:hypothetical protein DFH07DRAFT_778150 [Mycena maculata]